MNSEQRRLERYQVIYAWKIMEGLTPNFGDNWSSTTERNGRICKIPPVKGRNSVQTSQKPEFPIFWPKTFKLHAKEYQE